MNRRVFCVCPISWWAPVSEILRTELGPRWENGQAVQVEWLSERQCLDNRLNQSRVDSLTTKMVGGDIVLIGNIGYVGPQQPSHTVTVRRLKDPKEFGDRISDILIANGVDFLTERAAYLRDRWETQVVTRSHVAKWLSQFREIGSFEWVGKGVLLALDCLSTSEMLGRLGLEDLEDIERLSFYSPEDDPVGSSTPLAHAVAKRRKDKPMSRLDLGILKDALGSTLLIEDCAISGKEFEKFVKKTWAPDLPHLEDERLVNLRLRFAVLGNGAQAYISNQLATHGLVNVRLDTRFSRVVESLTEDGVRAVSAGTFYDQVHHHCLLPRQHIRESLFKDVGVWGTSERAASARRLLRKLGEQLYRQHFSEKAEPGESRSDRWFEQAGLGAGGLALTLALARSVPKSSLPVIWAEGRIRIGNKNLQWTPLLSHDG